MSDAPIFSRRLLLGFVAFALATFALSLFLLGRDEYGADRIGPSSHSVSALGYAGIAEVLKELGVPVVKSRRNPGAEAEEGVLVLAEPQLSLLPQMVLPVLPEAETILLVLPKWRWNKLDDNRTWIKGASALQRAEIEQTLRLAVDSPQLERRETVEGWTVNEIGVAPDLTKGVHLIKSDKLRPVVAAGEGILVGEINKNGTQLWVLSDPDVIANHAFSPEGKGAAFAVALIQSLRGGAGPVVFDETVHGFQSRPAQALRLLFEFPYSMITLQVVLAAVLLLWATMGRFGPPETPPPPLAAGKAGLIANVADLMEYAGHERLIIQRYVENTIRDTARQLRAPKTLTYGQTLDWLDGFARRRGIPRNCAEITRLADTLAASRGQADVTRFADAARQIYQWKQEILDGPSTHQRHH